MPPRDSKGRFIKKRSRSRRKRSRSRKRSRRNLPPRDSKGRFKSTGRSRSRRRSYRRNPGRVGGNIGRSIMDGGVAAVQLTAGKAVSRAVPPLLGLPTSGPVGVAVTAATAVAAGLLAEQVLPGDLPRRILEGGLQGALEDIIVGYDVPFIGPALARPPGMGGAGTAGLYTGGRPLRAHRSNPGRLAAYTGSAATIRNGSGLTRAHRN